MTAKLTKAQREVLERMLAGARLSSGGYYWLADGRYTFKVRPQTVRGLIARKLISTPKQNAAGFFGVTPAGREAVKGGE